LITNKSLLLHLVGFSFTYPPTDSSTQHNSEKSLSWVFLFTLSHVPPMVQHITVCYFALAQLVTWPYFTVLNLLPPWLQLLF